MKPSTVSYATLSLPPLDSSSYTSYSNIERSVHYRWSRGAEYEGASTNFNAFSLSSATTELHGNKSSPEVEIRAKKAAAYLVNLVRKDEYIAGETSKTELYLEKLYFEDKVAFRDAFQKAWLELFRGDDESLATFINVASSIEYSWLGDRADALVISGCCHLNPFVNEAAIRAIEAWSNPIYVEYLKKIKPFEISWLESYRLSVLEYLVSLQ